MPEEGSLLRPATTFGRNGASMNIAFGHQQGLRFGAHALPLNGFARLEDGMNWSQHGQGESVWAGLVFTMTICSSFHNCHKINGCRVC